MGLAIPPRNKNPATEAEATVNIANELKRYNIQVLGICESRWNGSGLTTLATGEKILYSGPAEENHDHTERVAIMMSPASQEHRHMETGKPGSYRTTDRKAAMEVD